MKWYMFIAMLCLVLLGGGLPPIESTSSRDVEMTAASGTDVVKLPDVLGNSSERSTTGYTIQWNSTQATCYNGTQASDQQGASFEENAASEYIWPVDFYVYITLLPTIAIPGCICNILNIIILSRRNMRSSTNYYLIALSVADLWFLLMHFVHWTFPMMEYFDWWVYFRAKINMRVGIIEYWLLVASGRTSNVFILVISLERFIAVKFPLKTKFGPMSQHPIKIIFGVFISIHLMILPNLFHTTYERYFDENTNLTFVRYTNTELYQSNPDVFKAHVYFLLITLRFIPVLFVLVLNICIIFILKRSRKSMAAQASNSEKRDKEQLKITRMLVAIAVIFLVCVTPGFVHTLLSNFLPSYSRRGQLGILWQIIYNTFPLCDMLNSTLNFFVYILKNDKFRAIFLETVCCKTMGISRIPSQRGS